MRSGAAGGPLDTPDGPCRPLCFGDGRDARPTYFNRAVSNAHTESPSETFYIGMTSRPAGLGQT